ncbi:DUF5988 family protein [Micromonospora sp. NPDC048898]|uniref:DUF5988 family protein n=1 Tax=Micromonospora sp. NPDC048898 TaxID=3364260 RepID=UPI003715551C
MDGPPIPALAEHPEVLLRGGPDTLPDELRRMRVPDTEEKVKLMHYGGHEHFEREAHTGDGPVVFRWTGRTRIAE